ncbi:hypothetical protein B0A48_18688 [Cryoendolithus antarcticus]|uniref:Uncharacterized protein n=1 Tax=Cryoendolithus antarcticus TaxID=1507870 RepID=A0A1V8S9S7_9PEZI|nr:hypothetical protein B0A48_18688 [Cryoendolithus antarcticus]
MPEDGASAITQEEEWVIVDLITYECNGKLGDVSKGEDEKEKVVTTEITATGRALVGNDETGRGNVPGVMRFGIMLSAY